MKSIHRTLIIRLSLCFGVVWLVMGCAAIWNYRSGTLKSMEAELVSGLRMVRIFHMSRMRPDMPPLQSGDQNRGHTRNAGSVDEPFAFLWQVWPLQSPLAGMKSQGLEFELPNLGAAPGETRIQRMRMAEAGDFLVVSGGFGAPGNTNSPGIPVQISAASPLNPLRDRMVKAILLAVFSAGGLTVLSTLWIVWTVNQGLAPLRNIAGIADRQKDIPNGSMSMECLPMTSLPSELKPIVQKLNQLIQGLYSSLQREKQFNSDLAHEVRTPISELRILAESAIKWPDSRSGDAWKNVLDASLDLERVVESMLTLARLDHGTQQITFTKVDLELECQHIVKAIQSRLDARNMNVLCEFERKSEASGAAIVDGDVGLVRQILSNLISNAAEYGVEGSTIKVSFYQQKQETASSDNWRMSICNQVKNIQNNDLSHMFDRFWRHDSARVREGHSGLGLSIAQSCALALGWNIHAELSGNGEEDLQQISFILSPDMTMTTLSRQ